MIYATSKIQHPNTVKLVTTPIFEWNYYSDKRIKINQGGTSAGKTYNILQVIFMRLIEKKRIATVVGQDIPNLKKGALRDFEERILVDNTWMNEFIESYNKTERLFRFKNGSILEFTSYKDKQDAKNGKREILFVNEADGVDWEIFSQLQLKTSEEVFIDYNPTAEFWAHDRLMVRGDAVTFYSNFTHNPFISPDVRDEIMSLQDLDMESWKVYGLGKTGSIHELCIEKPPIIVDRMPSFLKNRGYGMDFGYRANPTTLIECGLLNEKDIFLDEQFYLHRMKTDDMHVAMGSIVGHKRAKIYGDPADPRTLDELKARGWNMIPAIKGADSVNYGLQLINQYDLYITETSANILNERKRYRYKIDKKTGKVTNEPVKAFDHAWDAVRYWAVENLKPIRKIKSTWRSMAA